MTEKTHINLKPFYIIQKFNHVMKIRVEILRINNQHFLMEVDEALKYSSTILYTLMKYNIKKHDIQMKILKKYDILTFAEDIFPSIKEEPFRVLYSGSASRPNTPVNICIGALIIKELFSLSDDEVVENLMLDPRYQYALHTTSFEEQPLSDKTLSRFRKRCYDYEAAYGVDLLHGCMTDLGSKIAKMMDISPRIKRMDSMMIAANIRKLSRVELLYTCVAKLVIYFHKNGQDESIKGSEHYYDQNDYNKTFYYNASSGTEEQLKTILEDADRLLSMCGSDYDEVTEYQLLVRCLSEQTVVEGAVRRLHTKEDGGPALGHAPEPFGSGRDFPDKGRERIPGVCSQPGGSCGGGGSVVTDYQYEQNNYSDSQFLKDSLERTPQQQEAVTLVTDGAYSGKEKFETKR